MGDKSTYRCGADAGESSTFFLGAPGGLAIIFSSVRTEAGGGDSGEDIVRFERDDGRGKGFFKEASVMKYPPALFQMDSKLFRNTLVSRRKAHDSTFSGLIAQERGEGQFSSVCALAENCRQLPSKLMS